MGNALCVSQRGFSSGSDHTANLSTEKRGQFPPPYTSLTASLPAPALSDIDFSSLEQCIDQYSQALRKLSLEIHGHPELAWQEHHTHDVLVKFMQDHEFKVTPHAYNLETAWEASFQHGKGGPVIGFNSEMDALPGVGHACGHNLIAICGVAAALAVAAALKKHDIPGKVVLLGTPAEEKDGGKLKLIKAGAYKQMDICSMLHPAPIGGLCPMLAIVEMTAEFHGKGAHAAGAPWEGINALDAAVSVYNNISMLRQQIKPYERIHGLIKLKEDQPANVIPDWASVTYIVRSSSHDELEELKKRIVPIFKGAAQATGCDHHINMLYEYKDVANNKALGDAYMNYMKHNQNVEFSEEEAKASIGSTDFGDVTYEIPAIHPIYKIDAPPKQGNHTAGFTEAARTEDAHRKSLVASKGIAAAAWRFVVDKEFAETVKKGFHPKRR